MPKIQTTRVFAQLDRAFRDGFATVSEQGSARSGKTYNTAIWVVARCCLGHPGTLASVVRATLPALRGSVLRDFRSVMERMEVWDDSAFNRSELLYRFPNGSELEFFSCDNERKLRGRKRDWLFVNEANELDFLAWQQLQMRTTRLSIIDYNPSFSDDHWICSLNRDLRTYHFVTTYRENPFLERRVVEELESLKGRNASLWRIYGQGQQAQVEGLVFPDWDFVEDIPPSVRHRWYGVDYGYTFDPTAIVEVAIGGGDLYVDEKCYCTEMLTGDIIRAFKSLEPRRIISESADPRLVREIYRAGLDIHEVVKHPGSVAAGLSKMKEYRIHVTRRSVDVAKELRNYTWAQDREGRWLNAPADAYNHAIDAVRYVVMSEAMGGRPRPVDLGRLASIVH